MIPEMSTMARMGRWTRAMTTRPLPASIVCRMSALIHSKGRKRNTKTEAARKSRVREYKLKFKLKLTNDPGTVEPVEGRAVEGRVCGQVEEGAQVEKDVAQLDDQSEDARGKE